MAPLDDLAETLLLAGEAHHNVFVSTNGVDPNWGHWYAAYVLEHGVAPPGLTRDDLAARLFELAETDPGTEPWPRHYARALLTP